MATDAKDGGPGKLALAILGARPEDPGAGEAASMAGADDEGMSSESAAMDTAAGEMITAVEAGDRKGVVAAFEAMFRAKMGGDTDDDAD